jgi:hypothetical protein
MNNIGTWAKSLSLNNLIVSMVDKQAMTQSEKLCDACQFNTEIVKAVSWCNSLDRSKTFVDCFIPAAAVSMDITVSHFR